MNIPMHRFKYTKLTKEQIGEALKATETRPDCVSEFSDILAGKSLKIVAKDGPVLDYTFKDKNKLTLSENSGTKVEAGYGALTLKQMVFFSHMIPAEQKGYNVFVDMDTNLVTVIEVWFPTQAAGGSMFGGQSALAPREVQRQIYYGYIDGKDHPEKLHHTTNRIEGKGMYWKQDTGVETLEFYASIISTNFVELTRHVDDLSYCAPTDYVLVNDNMFIYDRTECEFSGIMTMYAVDLFTKSQVGMRLGFNEKDELEYYMFRGKGKVVGHLTALEPFDEHGEVINMGMGPAPASNQPARRQPKGQRTAYRPAQNLRPITEEEINKIAETKTVTFTDNPNTPQAQAGMMSGNTLPFSKLLAGKEFTLRYDHGPVYNYKVADGYNLEWKKEGDSKWQKETYRAFEADENLLFFAHMIPGSKPPASVKIALDLTNGLTTCIYSKVGSPYYGDEVTYEAFFGVAEMEGIESAKYLRHEFTDELVGRGFTRTYSDSMTSMHLYTTPHSSSWTIYMADQTLGMQWCAPAIYVKLRPGVYIFNLVEEACNGAETCIIENDNTMRASGFGFHGGRDGINLGLIGAVGRDLGQYNVKEFFGPMGKRKGE
ncbi:MAG: MoaF N-terminal domain-containing protein [Sedimentisphaerales bacterium]|nr:MoaF N-terminal domain-containing protein [Sedimentisphaerales bacterium]